MRIGKPIEKARVPFSLNKYYERLRPLINLAKHSSRQDFESRLLKKSYKLHVTDQYVILIVTYILIYLLNV